MEVFFNYFKNKPDALVGFCAGHLVSHYLSCAKLLDCATASGKNKTPSYLLWRCLDHWSCDGLERRRICSQCKQYMCVSDSAY